MFCSWCREPRSRFDSALCSQFWVLNAVETHEEPPSLCVTRTSPTLGRTAPLPEVPATPPRRGRLLSLQDAAGSGPAQHLSLRGGQSLLGLAHLAKQKRLELYWSFAFLHIADTLGGPTSTCSPPGHLWTLTCCSGKKVRVTTTYSWH